MNFKLIPPEILAEPQYSIWHCLKLYVLGENKKNEKALKNKGFQGFLLTDGGE